MVITGQYLSNANADLKLDESRCCSFQVKFIAIVNISCHLGTLNIFVNGHHLEKFGNLELTAVILARHHLYIATISFGCFSWMFL